MLLMEKREQGMDEGKVALLASGWRRRPSEATALATKRNGISSQAKEGVQSCDPFAPSQNALKVVA